MEPDTHSSDLHVLERLELAHFEEMEQLELACYGEEYITPAAEVYAWYLAAPDTTVALADAAGRIAGFINLFPITERVHRGLLAGTFNDRDLTAADVSSASPTPATGAPLHMFLSCIVVSEAHRGGGIVSTRLLAEAVARYAPIEHLVDDIVTDNVTSQGARFSRRWGFEPVCVSDHGSQVFAQPYARFVQRVREAQAGSSSTLTSASGMR